MSNGICEFSADAASFRLLTAAHMINVAYLSEPFAAVSSSAIEPLPHQISAVYDRMLMRRPLRFVLADDPGAGKTIMTGLLIKELILRGDVRRCLIVCPSPLMEQWQDELREKFQLRFEILAGEEFPSSTKFFIASIDRLARNENFQGKLVRTAWDLIVIDEAHKMSATINGNKAAYTKRFRIGRRLAKIARNFLLLTATPHNGKDADFYQFMSLIDADRFAGAMRIKNPVDVTDIMRRLVKEDLLTFDGKPLFPERRARTVNYSLSPAEMTLYNSVTAYVADGFNRAERLSGNKRNAVGFAMTILQRRLASSPPAIFKSLERRTERLKKFLHGGKFSSVADVQDIDDDFPSAELETSEDELAERVTASTTPIELRDEIRTLIELTDAAREVLHSGEDCKWRELSELLQSEIRREKLIIFTEHRDTLDYLRGKISSLFGHEGAVLTIHGGLNRNERRKVEERFRRDDDALILVATDAAGEGINLQNAHLMINYDLPWNPNRLEQRFGRIHRIGQRKICHLWNLVADGTREGHVFRRLLSKLDEARRTLGGKVFDIIGKVTFGDKPLRELLIEAVRCDDPAKIRRLNSVVDSGFAADKVREILRERSSTAEVFDRDKFAKIRRQLADAKNHHIEPRTVEKFFVAAFRILGGQIFSNGRGQYEVAHVPENLRAFVEPCRICFDGGHCAGAELISIGHPLLAATSDLILARMGDVLRQGAIFIGDDDINRLQVIFCVELNFSDGRGLPLAKRVHFVALREDGRIVPTNPPPYEDYRLPNESEREKILSDLHDAQLLNDAANSRVAAFVQKNFVAYYRRKFYELRKIQLDIIEQAVKSRLSSEIAYLDSRADDIAAHDADELHARLKSRLAEIRLERQISATVNFVSVALIVPRSRLDSETPTSTERARIEQIAMNAVMNVERELGNTPADISADNRGYDIESRTPDGHLRLIEVKGRRADADTVTVTVNEIRAALDNADDFILAIVQVDADNARVRYVKTPFTNPPDFAAVSVNYRISALLQGIVAIDRNISLGGD